MDDSSKYDALVLDATSAKALSRAEIELARSDARLSYSPLHQAAREQLLRIEAITSALVDARDVRYDDLVRLEAAVRLQHYREENYRYLCQLATRLGFKSANDVVVCFRYMRTIDWVSENIAFGEDVSFSLLAQIRLLFNEDYIDAFDSDADEALLDATASDEQLAAFREYIDFVNSDALTPASQAELSHAMLEAARPFTGRLDSYERIFSHVIFYKRGLLTKSVATLALGPSVSVKEHAKTLTLNMMELKRVSEGIAVKGQYSNSALCTRLASKTQVLCLETLNSLWRKWNKALGTPRSSSAVHKLAKLFLGSPLMSISHAADRVGCSFSTASEAMKALVKAGIVQEQGSFSKHRLYCAPDVMEAFDRFIASIHKNELIGRDDLLKEILESGR